MKILAIESSCDETAAAVVTEINKKPVILSTVVSSQIDLHKRFGGVVPEVAARAHIESIIPVIEESLEKSNTKIEEIDYLAVTNGPGLIGSLVVGVETAKAISVALGIPLVPVNHLEGHIYASFTRGISNSELRISNKFKTLRKPDLIKNSKLEIKNSSPSFPVLTLLVSGGNTLLILMKDHLHYQVLGQTIDDAAGEAFDKGAKLMNLDYPGGPIISERAKKGDENKYKLPIIDLTEKPTRGKDGFMNHPEASLNFSFSGLKTALLNTIKGLPRLSEKTINDLCASYQKAIVDTLIQNSIRAIKKYEPKTFVLAGGVAANPMLRAKLGQAIESSSPPWPTRACRSGRHTSYLIPPTSLCGDNAAMIGIAAYYKIRNSKLETRNSSEAIAVPNLKIV
jgi:N6-L-threonylcarbamoyladenine synthase